jgi:hypothetical protein
MVKFENGGTPMWRLECFVDDKRLASVLKMLTGQVYKMEAPRLVTTQTRHGEAKEKTGKPKHNSPSKEAHMRGFLATYKKPRITMTELKAEIVKGGWVANGYYQMLPKFLTEGALSKTKDPHTFKINRRKL